ncbi:MAG TPA: glycoside hydrolase family 16 protein [Candidatus Angelobacter sp.]|nr:glycoside hydrolase family 16 protein [Candidatus Angelobacter sp.]
MLKFRFTLTRPALLALASISLACAPVKGSSLLSNPGFEADPPGSSHNVLGWQLYGPNDYNESDFSIAHAGTNYFKVYQAFDGSVNYSGCYQDYISGPGATYSVDGWAYTDAGDAIAGQNAAWIEVTFRDANANILGLYRSALITTNLVASGGFPKSQWNQLPITNQYDPNTFQITNTVTQLVAPPGTIFLRYQIVFQGDAANSAGSVYFDDLNLAQIGSAPYGNMNIVWSDEFDGDSVKTNIWTYDLGASGWGNNELEYYTSRTNNSFVANGLLHIVARQESYNGSIYTSARMKSQGLFSFTCGRLEWRAQFPSGVGFWPALWLLGTNISTIGWPNCGEIDVFENTGTNTTMVQSSIHTGSDATAVYNFFDGDAVTNFHTYTLDWTTNSLLFYVDGHLFETQTNWNSSYSDYPFPFNQPFFLIMNFAIGGNYVKNPPPSEIDAHSVFPSEVLVDYVRLYNTTAPFRIAIEQTSSNLILTWPSNIVAHLQAQTNSHSSAIGQTWYPVSTATNKAAITPAPGNAFFRLTSP